MTSPEKKLRQFDMIDILAQLFGTVFELKLILVIEMLTNKNDKNIKMRKLTIIAKSRKKKSQRLLKKCRYSLLRV
jgi:hypothetical protein